MLQKPFFKFQNIFQNFFQEIFKKILQNFPRVYGENFKSLAQKMAELLGQVHILDTYVLLLVLCLSICACDYTVQTRAKAQSARVWTIINKNVHTFFCNFFRLNIFGIFLEDQYVLPCKISSPQFHVKIPCCTVFAVAISFSIVGP